MKLYFYLQTATNSNKIRLSFTEYIYLNFLRLQFVITFLSALSGRKLYLFPFPKAVPWVKIIYHFVVAFCSEYHVLIFPMKAPQNLTWDVLINDPFKLPFQSEAFSFSLLKAILSPQPYSL